MKDRGKKAANLVLLKTPNNEPPDPPDPLIVPVDLQLSIAAVALDKGYTEAEVLRFMLEEEIHMARQRA